MSTQNEIENLARMVKEGFDDIQNQLAKFATKDEFKALADEIWILRDDTRDIKNTMAPLAGIIAEHDSEIQRIKEEMNME